MVKLITEITAFCPFPAESRGSAGSPNRRPSCYQIASCCSFCPFHFSSSAFPCLDCIYAIMESEAFEDLQQKNVGALRTVKDLSAGAAGGIAQVLIGMVPGHCVCQLTTMLPVLSIEQC